jgi:transcriptional regulator with XRE-family HTH domain
MDIKQTFGFTIKKMRIDLGLSQETLAELTGLHRTYISSIERGERNVSLENIVALSKGLKCEPYILLRDIK